MARQVAVLHASLSPDRLNAYATILIGVQISSTPPGSQVPLTSLSVLLPSEIGLATSELGLENCVRSKLEAEGPRGCPPDSLMGRGTASAEIPIESEPVDQNAQVDVFSAQVQNGRLTLMVFVQAKSPVAAELVFPATIVPASPPYGEGVETMIPLIPSLPETPDVAVTHLQMALGATPTGVDHFAYYHWRHDERVAYSPRGLLLPPTCPGDGFPFEADFTFEDGSIATAHTTVPCPNTKHHTRT